MPSDWIVENCDSMFNGCASLESVDFIESWDTSKVTNMHATFGGCNNLISLDLSKWDVSNVGNMSWMFNWCENLVNLTGIDRWNVEKVKNMWSMFTNCKKLPNLDLSNWNTSSVTNMNSMFYSCNSLTSLNLGNWNVVKSNNLREMFVQSGLTEVDTTNWIKDKDILYNLWKFTTSMPNLEKIIIDGFKIDSIPQLTYDTPKIKEVHITNCDLGELEADDFYYTFSKNLKIINFKGSKNLNIPCNFDWVGLSVESIVSILEALKDLTGETSKTITLGSNIAKLTPEQIKIATDKNWTVV